MTGKGVLVGGPHDGRQVTVGSGTAAVETVFALPPRIYDAPPRPPWWRPIARRRWRPPPPPEPPRMVQLTYRADGSAEDGARLFRFAGEWKPYRGPEIDPGGDLYPAMLTALAAVHPAVRQHPDLRWVMNLDWYKRVRAMSIAGTDPDEDDPDKWVPDPADLVLGTPITVTDDGGLPHLENHRFPDGWPSTANLPKRQTGA